MSTPTSPEPDQLPDPPDAPASAPPRFRLSSSPRLRTLAAGVSLALVVALLGVVLGEAAGNRGEPTIPAGQITGSGKPTQPVSTWWPQKPTFTPTLPSGTPTPTLPPTSPAITPRQAWGANAASESLTVHIDASHVFRASSLTPDGRYLLGYETPAYPQDGDTSSSGYYDIASHQFTPIGITQPYNYPPICCRTDGRFLLAAHDTAPGTTCALCHLDYYVYDMNTKQLSQITHGTQDGLLEGMFIDHGLVMLGGQEQLSVLNVATRTKTQITLGGNDPAQQIILAFTWPYLIYTVPQPNGVGGAVMIRAYNLATNSDTALPHLGNMQSKDGLYVAVAGDTLFVTQDRATDSEARFGVTSIYECGACLSSPGTPRFVAAYAELLGAPTANTRLVLLSGSLVWDRAEQRFVELDPHQSGPVPFCILAGDWLASIQQLDQTNSGEDAATLYDTSALPTTLSA